MVEILLCIMYLHITLPFWVPILCCTEANTLNIAVYGHDLIENNSDKGDIKSAVVVLLTGFP